MHARVLIVNPHCTGAGGDRRDERVNDGGASEDTESEDGEVAAVTTLAQALASGSTGWVVTQHTRPVDHHLTGQRIVVSQRIVTQRIVSSTTLVGR